MDLHPSKSHATLEALCSGVCTRAACGSYRDSSANDTKDGGGPVAQWTSLRSEFVQKPFWLFLNVCIPRVTEKSSLGHLKKEVVNFLLTKHVWDWAVEHFVTLYGLK